MHKFFVCIGFLCVSTRARVCVSVCVYVYVCLWFDARRIHFHATVSRQRAERDTSTEETPSAQHHAVGAGQQSVAVQVEQKPATSSLLSSSVSSTVVAIRDPSLRPKYVCEICNKGFKSGYNLKRHTNDYHGENSSIIAAKGILRV